MNESREGGLFGAGMLAPVDRCAPVEARKVRLAIVKLPPSRCWPGHYAWALNFGWTLFVIGAVWGNSLEWAIQFALTAGEALERRAFDHLPLGTERIQ
jgi:hypothetical protein